jgi:hypothetical protein
VNATGEADSSPLRLQFDRSVKLAFQGSSISSDGGLLLHRELDDALGLTDMAANLIVDPRTGQNGRHRLVGLLRQSIFSRLARYEDVNDADRLCRDPVMRQLVGGRAVKRGAASASAMGRFETEMLTRPENLAALAELPGRWIDAVHDRRPPKSITLDMDSSESPVHGEQEGAAWNGHFQSKCLHPLFVFNQFGDLERCVLRPGNVHSADGWEEVLRPVLARYAAETRPSITRRGFRADAAFAIPALFDLLEAEGWDYAIRVKGNAKLQERISWLTKRYGNGSTGDSGPTDRLRDPLRHSMRPIAFHSGLPAAVSRLRSAQPDCRAGPLGATLPAQELNGECRLLRLLVALLTCLIAGAASAQPSSPWRTQLQGGAVHQFETDLDDGGDLSVDRLFIEGGLIYAFDPRRSVGVALAYGYDGYDFSGDGGLAGLDPWDGVNEYRVSAPVRWGFGERFDLFAVPSIRWTAETSVNFGEGMSGGVNAGFSYKVNDSLRIGPGIGVFTEIEDSVSVFPIFVIDWLITDALALRTGAGLGATRGPGLTLSYRGVEDWEFTLGARYEKYRFRLDDGGVAPDGVGEESAVPLFLSAAYDPLPFVRLSAVGGVDIGGELSLEDSSGREIEAAEFDPAPFLGVTFRARF